uniref:Uncharacterized protein n=1 Tax=Arundo donax TaxID=35708 RepID=A0A0A8Y266_ARUDO
MFWMPEAHKRIQLVHGQTKSLVGKVHSQPHCQGILIKKKKSTLWSGPPKVCAPHGLLITRKIRFQQK